MGEEVAKHVTKDDCWVILSGKVLNVTSFLSQHPGGELAILTFAGKDATAEFDMIHPPDVLGKYAPDAIIGKLGEGGGGGDDESEDESDAENGGGAGAGRPSARPSVRRVVKVEKKEARGFGVISLRDGCAWHLSKMDSTTWGIFLLTALFLVSVVLSLRTQ